MIFEQYPDILTAADLAEILGISAGTTYRLLKGGQLPSVRLGNSYRVAKSDLLEFLHRESRRNLSTDSDIGNQGKEGL